MPQWLLVPVVFAAFGALCYREARRGRFGDAMVLRTARFGLVFAILAAAAIGPVATGAAAAYPAFFGAAAGSIAGALLLCVALSASIVARRHPMARPPHDASEPVRWPDYLPANAHRISHSLNGVCVAAVGAELLVNLWEARPLYHSRGIVTGAVLWVAFLYSGLAVFWLARKRLV
jgi:hypothetical protein